MGRKPCCAKEGLNRGAWSRMEDQILTNYIKLHGEGQWRDLPQRAGLQRCGKSCRLRWRNYLRPDIKRGNISTEEDELIVKLHKLLGNRWSLIAGRLPGRTDNEIKNYWNTNLSKRLKGHSSNITPKPTKANDSNLQLNKIGKLQADNEHEVIRTKAVKCTRAVNVNINIPRAYSLDNNHSATYKLGPKTENSTAREHESKSPSLSLIQNDENFTDLLMDSDINELLAPHASILDSHEMQQVVCENGNDVAGNAGYGHDFSLYMDDDLKVFVSKDEAKPDNLRTGTQLVQVTPTSLDFQSLEAYLNFEEELIN